MIAPSRQSSKSTTVALSPSSTYVAVISSPCPNIVEELNANERENERLDHIRMVLWRLWCGTLKSVMWYFEECDVVLWRGWCGTLKRVVWYFEEGDDILLLKVWFVNRFPPRAWSDTNRRNNQGEWYCVFILDGIKQCVGELFNSMNMDIYIYILSNKANKEIHYRQTVKKCITYSMITMRNTCTLIHQTIRIPAEIDPSTFKNETLDI